RRYRRETGRRERSPRRRQGQPPNEKRRVRVFRNGPADSTYGPFPKRPAAEAGLRARMLFETRAIQSY
ncbi:MAG: hypothetical protein ACREBW_00775, partial [Candidatus Micrarchaeaceae archaeon]